MTAVGAGEHPTGFRGAWRHRRWRWLIASVAVSMTGDFLYLVAIVVVLIERTGSAGWVAAAYALRVAVYVVFGPFAGAIADRNDRQRLMVGLDLGRFVVMSTVAIAVWADAGVAVVIALTVLNATLTVPYRAAAVAATPHVVDEDDLAAANAIESVVGQLAFFIGPALGALVVATTNPAFAFAVNGATFALSAVLVRRVGPIGGGRGADAPEGDADDARGSLLADVVDGAREVRRSPGLLALMTLTAFILFQVGAEGVLHVLVARDGLGRGADFVGVMVAVMGIGGLVVAPFASRIGTTRWSGALLAVSGVMIGLPTVAIGLALEPVPVLGLLAIEGIGIMVFEVAFVTMLQRWCREAALARVYGLNDSLTAATEIVGAVAAPVLVASVGLESSLAVVGSIVVAGSVLVAPVLHRESQRSEERRKALLPAIAELEALEIFEGASRAAFERLAAARREVAVPAGATVFAEGDLADALYLVRTGSFVAESATLGVLSTMEVGDWFGEIGVLRQLPRTATVRAVDDATAWVIDGAVFADAVAGPLQTRGLLRGTLNDRLARTHPGHESIDA